MSDVPIVNVIPPLRCQFERKNSGGVLCGKSAARMRHAAGESQVQYFCSEHARARDVAIPESGEFLRVRLAVDVTFAGASWLPGVATTEALERLRLAVEAAGGILNLIGVNYQVVGWTGKTPAVGAATIANDPH
jgi:hypothetical protein